MGLIPDFTNLIPGASGILSTAYDKLTKWVKDYIGAPFNAVYSVLVKSPHSIAKVVKLSGDALGVLVGEWDDFRAWGPLIIFRWLLLLLKWQTTLFIEGFAEVMLTIIGGSVQLVTLGLVKPKLGLSGEGRTPRPRRIEDR